MPCVYMMGVVGRCECLGYTSSAGASYNLDDRRARAYCAFRRSGVVWTFLLSSIFSLPSSLPLGEGGWSDGLLGGAMVLGKLPGRGVLQFG